MNTLNVYCTYHNEYGTCTEEDYNDAKTRRNPSGMVRVQFAKFTHAVPVHTLVTKSNYDIKLNGDMAQQFNESNEDYYPEDHYGI